MIRASVSRLTPAVFSCRSSAASSFATLSVARVQIPGHNTAVAAAHMSLRRRLEQDEEARNALAYCLSFSNDESDFSRNMLQLFPDARMQAQLKNCTAARQNERTPASSPMIIDTKPLPRTLEDALRCQTSRAIVITEATKPFRIVHVNHAWEGLCGYSFVQAQHQTLGKLVQGPETDPRAATQLIASLLAGEPEAGTTLTNYTGTGRRFRNRVRVGPLYKDDENGHHGASSSSSRGVPTHFVAVLQEVNDGM